MDQVRDMDTTRASYKRLYALQDEVLALIFRHQLGFYLSGGTALSRGYFHHRYSDDLDLFLHDTNLFGDALRVIGMDLERRFPNLSTEVEARDFRRFRIVVGADVLKVDFVADRTPRIGLPVTRGSWYLDTVRNILSNKISAVLSRDEARDVADIVYICNQRRFDWDTVLSEARQKQTFATEDLVYRLHTFPPASFSNVPFQDPIPSTKDLAHALETIGQDIVSGAKNSLAADTAMEL